MLRRRIEELEKLYQQATASKEAESAEVSGSRERLRRKLDEMAARKAEDGVSEDYEALRAEVLERLRDLEYR